MMETIKLLHVSDEEMRRRVVLQGTEVVERIADDKHPIILFLGHYGNWEWVPALTLSLSKPRIMGDLYKPLRQKMMNRLMLRIRSRFTTIDIVHRTAYRTLLKMKREYESFMIGFIADQRPLGRAIYHWTEFLGQNTAFMAGGETIGNRIGAKYVYLDVERTGRGHYLLTFKEMVISDDDKNQEFPYTRLFYRMLEQSIRRAPAYWLWSHNRWKSARQRYADFLAGTRK